MQKLVKNRDIICFSFSDWDNEMVSNRYHMISRFAENNRVFFFELPVNILTKRAFKIFNPIRRNKNMIIVSPVLFVGNQDRVLNFYLNKLYEVFRISKPIFWIYNFMVANLMDWYKPVLSCYHCTENYSRLTHFSDKSKKNEVFDMETNLLEKVNLAFAVSYDIADNLKKRNENVYISLNAVDYNLYCQGQGKLKISNKKIIGYAGNLSAKVDFELLYKIAKENIAEIWLIGPLSIENQYVAKLKKMDNVKFWGRQSVNELPLFYKKMDVLLITYIHDGWFVKTVQPLKLFEYMATGKPIVSTPMTCLKDLKNVVYESHGHEEFITNIKAALKEDCKKLSDSRIKIAKENTWDKRFEFINLQMLKFLK